MELLLLAEAGPSYLWAQHRKANFRLRLEGPIEDRQPMGAGRYQSARSCHTFPSRTDPSTLGYMVQITFGAANQRRAGLLAAQDYLTRPRVGKSRILQRLNSPCRILSCEHCLDHRIYDVWPSRMACTCS